MQFAEWGWMPHDYHSVRKRLSAGLSHPDDVRAMHMSTLNRRHRYKEHYLKSVNDKTRMVGFWWIKNILNIDFITYVSPK